MTAGRILARAHDKGEFSGAAWAYGTSAGPVGRDTLGTLSRDGAPVGDDTLWDLASVTKPIVGLAVMALVESGELTLDDTVESWLPDYAGTDKAGITVHELLTHTSRIPGRQPLYRHCPTRRDLLDTLVRLPLRERPGVEYSSQGFMILGMIAESAAGVPLDRLVRERVTAPLGLDETRFLLPEHDRARAAATEDCPWRGRIVQGTVHDENAEVLGGVAGHAGMFGTLDDLSKLGQALCRGGDGVVAPHTLAVMTGTRTGGRALAWKGHEPRLGSGGDLLTPSAYGHDGFTGTSLWVDPELDFYAVLLTNRVHPSRDSNGIARIRRTFHNAAVTRTLS
ncbi:class A beta-lactamase-related serine hydrolase [Nonomuraea mesophila]|uniref:Class A beta-lactamase-related serine hydrolase n=1 Tax=Nonomuraea mesophila TaxID=2530382 RepID=A0A4R5FLG8_9ACTN|nr:serine hydrolase domain-containing protein [Nonomuraea mesophila]TDE53512.1 class A beta-lactamase-related serine hydrolase [Nonomuraea mesophila]